MSKLSWAWMLSCIALLALFAATATAVLASEAPFRDLREQVLTAARPAFRGWIEGLPAERLADFGFRSPAEARQATLLRPIPSYAPDRSRGVTRKRVETALESPPDAWLVPVATGGEVVCLITVETRPGRSPEVIELGKAWAARRLEAGLRSLRETGGLPWDDLRFVVFVNPNVDLLLVRRPGGKGWRWLNLLGSTASEAHSLESRQIDELLQRIQDTPPQEIPFP